MGIVVLLGCARAKPPDVVFVTLDTTRADHLGVYGHFRPTSPEIDRFARDGVTFRRAWSTAPWTLPSHASMFTGQLPRTHGARFNEAGEEMFGNRASRLSEDATTLAEILQSRDLVLAEAHRSKVFTRLAPDRYARDLVAAIRWPWKLIVADVGDAELYRIDDDPTELRDRQGDAVQAGVHADLDHALTRLPPPAEPAAPGKVDPELTKRLRELGYIA